jgi:hypothetical protein
MKKLFLLTIPILFGFIKADDFDSFKLEPARVIIKKITNNCSFDIHVMSTKNPFVKFQILEVIQPGKTTTEPIILPYPKDALFFIGKESMGGFGFTNLTMTKDIPTSLYFYDLWINGKELIICDDFHKRRNNPAILKPQENIELILEENTYGMLKIQLIYPKEQ